MSTIPLKVRQIPFDKVVPAPYNPRTISEENLDRLEAGIRKWGLLEPLVWNERSGHLVGGHQRMEVLVRIHGEPSHLPCRVVDLDDTEERALNIALNNPHLQGEYDEEVLRGLLEDIKESGDEEALEGTGFSEAELDELLADVDDEPQAEVDIGALSRRFVVPPFSVLDTRKGVWQDRKAEWQERLGDEATYETREDAIRSSGGPGSVMRSFGGKFKGGEMSRPVTSIFDPVLAELAYRWFNVPGGSVLDPFAGAITRGAIAVWLGHPYTGIELREEQVEANRKAWAATTTGGFRSGTSVLEGDEATAVDPDGPQWIHGDSSFLDELLPDGELYDMVLTSPPYFDREEYGGGPGDISQLRDYSGFLVAYRAILESALARLRDDRFLVIQVSEIRDAKTGAYRHFVGDTVRILQEAGAHYLNELILVTAVGSLQLRVGRYMRRRKVGRTHQNVLVFYKGDLGAIIEEFPNLSEDEAAEQE